MKKLTNKQLLVLDVLRDGGEWTANDIADEVTAQTPCPVCPPGEATRECRKCYGRGSVMFMYAAAYQALQALRTRGLVDRRCKRDEWGDELPLHVYSLVAQPDSDDPLERAFAAPAAPSQYESEEG